VIDEQPDRFNVAGKDVEVTFDAVGGRQGVVELGKVEEGGLAEMR
jgi:hypothetical protein